MDTIFENYPDNVVPEMVTLREAARRTGFSYDFLRKECLKGNLVYIQVGNGKFLLNFGYLVERMNNAHGSVRRDSEKK